MPVPARPRPVADVPPLDPVGLAHEWLVALVAGAPLERAAALPGPGFAAEAPLLCRAVVDALGGDDALAALAPGGARAALAARAGVLGGAEDAVAAVAAVEALRAVVWAALGEELRRPPPARVADLADRLAAVGAVVTAAAVAAAADGGGSGAPAWTAAIDRALAGGAPVAVLCLEAAELDRLLAADAGDRLGAALHEAEQALAGAVAPGAVHVPERPGRAWVVVPGAGAAAAREEADRLAAAVAGRVTHAGAPLHVAVGIAVAPGDGTTAAQLEARAEEGLFAARASGVRVAD